MTDTAGAEPANAAVERPRQLDKICFVIGRPRSGTTVFKRMLESHPRFLNMGEVFNESNPNCYFRYLQQCREDDPQAFFPSRSIDNFLDYLRWCRERARKKKPSSKWLVLDVKYEQAHLLCQPWWGMTQLPKLFWLIKEKRWHVIDICRKDTIGAFISNQVAMKTGLYHSNGLDADGQQAAKVRIKPEALLNDISAAPKAHRRISQHFQRYGKYLNVNYEDMFDSGLFSPVLLTRLADFFGVENNFDPEPKLSKILSENVLAHVENADEIRETLARKGIALD